MTKECSKSIQILYAIVQSIYLQSRSLHEWYYQNSANNIYTGIEVQQIFLSLQSLKNQKQGLQLLSPT